MALTKRSGVYHIDLAVPGRARYRATTGTRDLTIAKARHAEVERALRLGHALGTGRTPVTTLGDLFDRTLRLHWRGQKGVQTVLSHRDAVLRVIPASTPLPDVGRRVEALVEAMRAAGKSPATINRTLQTLRKALTLAVEWDLLARVPKLPRFREPSGRIRVYTPEEEAAILAWLDVQDPAVGRLVRVLFATGFRLAEVLRRDKLVVGPGSVTVWDTKTGGGRTVPVSPVTRVLVEQLPPLDKDAVEWRWRKMREALNLGPDAVIHAIRHTCVTRLIRGGMSVPKVMLWAGHRDVHTTMRYTHMAVEDLAEGVALVAPGVPSAAP